MFNMTRVVVVLLIFKLLSPSHEICSHIYGGDPCSFTPSPRGRAPPCARPGQTFCENPENYPGYLIQFLVVRNRFDTKNLVKDETKDDFFTGYPPANYESKIPKDTYFPEPIDIPKPKFPAALDNGQLNTYVPPNFDKNVNFTDGFRGYPDRVLPNEGYIRYKFGDLNNFLGLTPSEKLKAMLNLKLNLWRRDGKFAQFLTRLKRSEKERQYRRKIRESPFKANSTGEIKYRNKRQFGNSEQLCATRSQFIMPRAALNKDGNWKYIVNMQDNDAKYTQLVRSETCASQTCSSLCGLPNGYTSKCEQKYIQKRLVALEGQGDQLYTDVFWIPSCCVCTITRN